MIESTAHRRGLTLLELLVVVFIIAIVAAMAIPIFNPDLEKKAVREGARVLSTALGMARNRAVESGRASGIQLQPVQGSPLGAINLHFVDVPPPYAGDSLDSVMELLNVNITGAMTSNGQEAIWTVYFPEGDPIAVRVEVGDMLKLNYQGHLYLVTAMQQSGANWVLTVASKTVLAWPATGLEYRFQFFRQPKRTTASPVTMPEGALVDLAASGIGFGRFNPTETFPITITFTPTGMVDKVFHPNKPAGERLFDSVFFLVGKRGAYGQQNLADLDNLWVSVGYQTGLITTAENAYVNEGNPNINSDADVSATRQHARSGQSIGG